MVSSSSLASNIFIFKKNYKYRFKTKVKSKLVCLSQAHIYISNVAVSSSLINSFEFEPTIEYVGEMVRVFFSLINGFKFEPTIEYVGEMVMSFSSLINSFEAEP